MKAHYTKPLTFALLLMIGSALAPGKAEAQAADTAWWNMDFIINRDARLSGRNATGLKYLPLQKIATAKAYFGKYNGSFKDYNQSDDSYDFGASSSSLYRLTDKVVLSGGIAYLNAVGKNMGGSAFIDPALAPFDLAETDDSNKGKKSLERYQLEGAVSAALTSKFTVGGKVAYETANYAKAKDLRHINKLLDLTVAPGLSYDLSNKLALGLSYEYNRRIESIQFRSFGNTDEQFLTLISYGAFYGRTELFGNAGYTADQANRPVTSITNTASIQLTANFSEKVRLLNEFSYGKLSGYAGLKGSASVRYTEHEADKFGYKGSLNINNEGTAQQLSVSADYQRWTNNENIYREQTSTGGLSSIVYYGQTEVMNRDLFNASLQYSLYLGTRNYNPAWTLKAGANYYQMTQTVTLFPYYRNQDLKRLSINLGAEKHITYGNSKLDLLLGGSFSKGSGTAKYDGLYAIPSSEQGAPKSMDLYLQQSFEFATAPAITGFAGLQYSVKRIQNVVPFARIDYAYTRAFDVSFVGKQYQSLRLSLGCNF